MDIKILHFYPDLMSLYGSYANVSVLKRALEALGDTVTVFPNCSRRRFNTDTLA